MLESCTEKCLLSQDCLSLHQRTQRAERMGKEKQNYQKKCCQWWTSIQSSGTEQILTLVISFYSPDNFFFGKRSTCILETILCQSGLTSYHNHSLWWMVLLNLFGFCVKTKELTIPGGKNIQLSTLNTSTCDLSLPNPQLTCLSKLKSACEPRSPLGQSLS